MTKIPLILVSFFISVNVVFADSWHIDPRGIEGPLTITTTESDLIQIYGKDNVEQINIGLGEGETEPGTALFPNIPLKRIEILWKDPIKRAFPKRIQITGDKTEWNTSHSISLGTTLKELEKINGRAFTLAGFGWDYSGTIYSWEGGKLENKLDPKAGIWMRLNERTKNKVSEQEARLVMGEKEFRSDNFVMQKINPKIYQVIFEFR